MYSSAWVYFTIPFDHSCVGRLVHRMQRQEEKQTFKVLPKYDLYFKHPGNGGNNKHGDICWIIRNRTNILSVIVWWLIPIWSQCVLYDDILHPNEKGYNLQVLGRSVLAKSQHDRSDGLLDQLQGLPNALESFPEPQGVQCSLHRWAGSPEDKRVYWCRLYADSFAPNSGGSSLWNRLHLDWIPTADVLRRDGGDWSFNVHHHVDWAT